MSLDFLMSGLAEPERQARCRELRALATVYCGLRHLLTAALQAAISDPAAIGQALAETRRTAGSTKAAVAVSLRSVDACLGGRAMRARGRADAAFSLHWPIFLPLLLGSVRVSRGTPLLKIVFSGLGPPFGFRGENLWEAEKPSRPPLVAAAPPPSRSTWLARPRLQRQGRYARRASRQALPRWRAASSPKPARWNSDQDASRMPCLCFL